MRTSSPAHCTQGVGEVVAACQAPKIFLLNGSPDREVCYQRDTWGPVPLARSVSSLAAEASQQGQLQQHASAPSPPGAQRSSAADSEPQSQQSPAGRGKQLQPHASAPASVAPTRQPSASSLAATEQDVQAAVGKSAAHSPSVPNAHARDVQPAASSSWAAQHAAEPANHRAQPGASSSTQAAEAVVERTGATQQHEPGSLADLYRRPGSPTVHLPTHRKARAPHFMGGFPKQLDAPAEQPGSEQASSSSSTAQQQEFSFCSPPQAGPSMRCMTASEMVLALSDALNRRQGPHGAAALQHPPSAYVTALIVPERGSISVDREQLAALGITQVHTVQAVVDAQGKCTYDADSLVDGIAAVLDSVQ